MSQLFTEPKGLSRNGNHHSGGGQGLTTDVLNVSRPIILMLGAAVLGIGIFLHFMATPLPLGPVSNWSIPSDGHAHAINPSVLNLQNRESARLLRKSH